MAFIAVLFLITALAWNCDDAYHAYVMARNLVEGNGFVYHVGERVNASTCPLFTLAVAGVYAVVGDMYLSGILTCLVFSGIAVWIVFFRFCRSYGSVLLAFLCLGGAAGFITYATSGLENCLLFFMIACFYRLVLTKEEFGKKDLFLTALVIGVLMGARMDNVLLVAPAAVSVFFFRKKKDIPVYTSVGLGILGAFPFWMWEIFSVIYYGFLFPNTAYIKLGTGFPLTNYLSRGISYMITALLNDPVLLLLPAAYLLLALLRKERMHLLMAGGCVLYLCYVIYIGGDFMLGRHLTVPFFSALCGTVLLTGGLPEEQHRERALRSLTFAAACCILFAASYGPLMGRRYLWTGDKYLMQCSDVADERAYYFPTTGLPAYLETRDGAYEGIVTQTFSTVEVDELLEKGEPGGELKRGASGILVYYYLEGKHVFDAYGLADAFLARLPALHDEKWRVGHMMRGIPAGYEETVKTGENRIEDPALHEFYDKLSIVIKGEIWSAERFQTIWKMNTGYYNNLLGY